MKQRKYKKLKLMEQNSNSNNESNQDTLVNSDKQKKPLITFAKINKYFIIPFLTHL